MRRFGVFFLQTEEKYLKNEKSDIRNIDSTLAEVDFFENFLCYGTSTSDFDTLEIGFRL